MQITIKNCNNIGAGKIELRSNCLNIKFAPNGTGKSTIAKAVIASIKDREPGSTTLSELTPFRYIGSTTEVPYVSGTEEIKTTKIFDENYINDFVFQADELLKGSFDIFIHDENYEKGMNEIDVFVQEIRTALSEDKEIETLIQDFDEISNSFGRPARTGLHGSSGMAKSLKGGNKVTNIPTGLEGYKDFIQHTENFRWIKWQLEGKSFGEISHDCPYCITNISEKKETIQKISEVYDPKAIENLNKIVGAFERLSKYFSDDAKQMIKEFVQNVEGYNDDQVAYLKEVKDQIDRLRDKFRTAKSLGFVSLKDVDQLIERLNEYRIDIDLFVHLKSESTISKIDIVNKALQGIIEKAGALQGSINKQKRIVEKLVAKNSDDINGFLKNAGYSYSVKLIEDASGKHRLKLVHNDTNDEVTNARSHLSFGERNAFSLVLFMYDVLKSKPDLIVLDDPISSFDKNKKYAIMEMLFRKGNSLRDQTVLFLTHDFEPIVDLTYHHSDRFSKPFSSFLENIHGELQEKEILKTDIRTFMEINQENLIAEIGDVSKLVYLRRLLEITNDKNSTYDVVSSLLHKRAAPSKMLEQVRSELTAEEIQSGVDEIRRSIPFFDYPALLTILCDKSRMIATYNATTNNYEKLHIYRIIFEGLDIENIESDIIRKFINEAFHIENSNIYQLNPRKYQLVPQYVIDECDRFIQQIA